MLRSSHNAVHVDILHGPSRKWLICWEITEWLPTTEQNEIGIAILAHRRREKDIVVPSHPQRNLTPRPSLKVNHVVGPFIIEYDVRVWTTFRACLLEVVVKARYDSEIRG